MTLLSSRTALAWSAPLSLKEGLRKLPVLLDRMNQVGESQLPVLHNLSHPVFHNPALKVNSLLGGAGNLLRSYLVTYLSEQSTSSSDIPRLAECSADEDQLHGHHTGCSRQKHAPCSSIGEAVVHYFTSELPKHQAGLWLSTDPELLPAAAVSGWPGMRMRSADGSKVRPRTQKTRRESKLPRQSTRNSAHEAHEG